MTLPVSGPISIQAIANELGISATGLSLNDSRCRALAGVPSGPISLSNFYGKSNNPTPSVFTVGAVKVTDGGIGHTAVWHVNVNVTGGTPNATVSVTATMTNAINTTINTTSGTVTLDSSGNASTALSNNYSGIAVTLTPVTVTDASCTLTTSASYGSFNTGNTQNLVQSAS